MRGHALSAAEKTVLEYGRKVGDSIQYLRDFRGLSYKEACLFVGRNPGLRKETYRPAPTAWAPKEANTPSELWRGRAKVLLNGMIDSLWSKQGESMLEWLRTEKGLNDAIIKEARLGYNPADIYEPQAKWGLETQFKDDGAEKRLWIPAGLVIPLIIKDEIIRLRIRRNDPGDGPRYVITSGSSNAPLIIGQDKAAFVIVESELDALLLSQEAGDIIGVIALGTATAKPDKKTNELLKAALIILISLDTDDAGTKASWRFWPEQYGKKARRWPSVCGKDASDARLNGLDLRAWIVAGIFESEWRFERFCIQTIDGGMTDAEAMKAMSVTG